jgi:membrane protein
MVADQLTTLTTASDRGLTVRGLAGLVIAVWTATAAMLALIDALTIAYHETETRAMPRRILLALTFVLGGALMLGAVLAVGGLATTAVADAPDPLRLAGWALGWLVLAVLMSAALAVLYRFGPDRKEPQWRWANWGAVGATVLWATATIVLFAYVQTLGTYRTTYGSLAGVAISMFWVWMTVLLVVLGAAINGEAERQTARDSTVGPERPLGSRGAVVADSTPQRLERGQH